MKMGIVGKECGVLVGLVGGVSMSGSTVLGGYVLMERCFFVDGYWLEVVGTMGFVVCVGAGILVARLPLQIRRKETEMGVVALSRWSVLLRGWIAESADVGGSA